MSRAKSKLRYPFIVQRTRLPAGPPRHPREMFQLLRPVVASQIMAGSKAGKHGQRMYYRLNCGHVYSEARSERKGWLRAMCANCTDLWRWMTVADYALPRLREAFADVEAGVAQEMEAEAERRGLLLRHLPEWLTIPETGRPSASEQP